MKILRNPLWLYGSWYEKWKIFPITLIKYSHSRMKCLPVFFTFILNYWRLYFSKSSFISLDMYLKEKLFIWIKCMIEILSVILRWTVKSIIRTFIKCQRFKLKCEYFKGPLQGHTVNSNESSERKNYYFE